MSMNKVILIGSLADKPQVRETGGGQKIVGLSIVTTRHWRDLKSGEEQQGQEWHRVVIVHEDLAAFAEAKLAKSDDVYLEGELLTERWMSETFETRTLTKIILWQEAHQLRRLADHDHNQEQRAYSVCQHPLLDVAREAPLIETPSGDPLLGHVV